MAATIEDFRRFSVHDLKRLGMLRDGFNGSINWQENGETVSTIGLAVGLSGCVPAVRLHYAITDTGEKVADLVKLLCLKSNLPNHAGGYWMFVCPVTGNPCRVLYLHDGHFKSRKALPPGTIYKCQTCTGYFQTISRAFAYEKAVEELANTLQKPYRKGLYCGKPTRTAKRLLKKTGQLERAMNGFLSV